jgi:hypothetical protein
MVWHIELNSWAQAEQHFRDVDQDQGREHYDREMFNCEHEALAVKNTIVHAMSELGQRPLGLLTGFYEESQTPLPCRLVIQANGLGSYTLLNQGAIVGLLSDQETLKAYQDEFMAFAEYLKSIWGR